MNRRSFLRGLFAAPAIVAASSLMPIRGIVMAVPTIVIKPTFDSCDVVWEPVTTFGRVVYMTVYNDDTGKILYHGKMDEEGALV